MIFINMYTRILHFRMVCSRICEHMEWLVGMVGLHPRLGLMYLQEER